MHPPVFPTPIAYPACPAPIAPPVDPYIQWLVNNYGGLWNPDNYPCWLFPDVIRQAFMSVAYQTGAPLPLIGASALGALSLSLQAQLDVQSPYGSTEPCALYLITLGQSGERKTTCDRMFMRELHAVHDRLYEQSRAEYDQYLRMVEERKKRRGKADPQPEPVKPKVINMISSNATPAAIRNSLHEFSPFGSLMSDEAGTVLRGPGASDPYLLNQLWDGAFIDVNRRSTGLIRINSPRFTLSLMLQPEVFAAFKDKQNNLAETSGLLPRSLVSFPQSTQGFRSTVHGEYLEQGIKPLQQTLGEWLEKSWRAFVDGEPRRTVACDPGAQQIWRQFSDEIEFNSRPGACYSQITAFASKAGSHALRMAALFSQFQQDPSFITQDSMFRAMGLVRWYLGQYLMLFGPQSALSKANLDMRKMREQISQACRETHSFCLLHEFVTQYVLRELGTPSKVNAVLSLLEQSGAILIGPHVHTRQKTIACLFLSPEARMWILPAESASAPRLSSAAPAQTRRTPSTGRKK